MITCKALHGQFKNQDINVDGLVNRGQWFGKTWLISIGMGFESCNLVIEADNEQEAIDTLTDSRFGHLIKTDELCDSCLSGDIDNCTCEFGGNSSERINTDEIRILARVRVNYFAKKA